jgi:hypothetical protein
MRQTILHSITDIVAVAAADVMDMEKDKDRAGDSTSRTLTVRRPRSRESNYKVSARFCGKDLAGTDPFQREKRRTQRAMGIPTKSGCPIGPVM